MNNRIGTGNYDKERTKFNIKYKELESKQKELPEPKETIIDYEDANY
jgi:hypothetical protein